MKLDQSALERALRQSWSGDITLDVFETLGSTNHYLKSELASASGKSERTRLCVTARQTAGVGRQGRTWHSPDDSITFSLQHKFTQPAAQLMGLSLVTGIAVADVLAEHITAQIALKWPNDLLIDGQKLAGILIELPRIDQTGCICIAGIGINFADGPEHLKVDQPFTTLSAHCTGSQPDKSQLIGRLAGSVLGAYDQFVREGWQAFAARWTERDFLYGQAVNLNLADQVLHGTASGVAEDGGLIVRQGDTEQVYYSGEVSVRLTKSS